MATVEGRILGSDPKLTAANRLAKRKFKIISENEGNDFVDHFPHIFPQETGVRYSPFDGNVWIATYFPSDDAEDIVLKRWSKHTSLESATGASAEILSQYDSEGIIVGKTMTLARFIKFKLSQFGEGSITHEQLIEFRNEADVVLQDLGFEKKHRPSDTIVTERVRSAMGRDSMGRRNPLISRTRLASALLTVLTEREFHDKVAAKHHRLFLALLGEQQLEEACVKLILAEFSKRNFTPEVLKKAALDPLVKTSPYRIPVMQAYASLFGTPPHRKKEFAKYFENDGEIFDTLNSVDVSDENKQRIIITNLETALEDGASIYSPSV